MTLSGGPQTPPPALPKLRGGLTYTFNDYDADGKPQWLLHDAGRNKFFIIGWPDYEMLIRWNLSDPEDLIYAVNNETTLNIDMNDLNNLLQFLAYNYLIDQSGKKIMQSVKDQQMFKDDDNLLSWLISHYLFFRIPIWHPDNFLTKTKRFGDFLFSKYLLYTMIILGFVAVYQVGNKWELFTSTFPSIISLRGLFFYFISFSIVKIMHEAGHAYRCKRYGIPIPSCGLAFLVFWPVLYTDTTLSWTLNSQKRMYIALSGIQIETYVTIIAALIWCNTSNVTIQTICYVTITVNWMSSLLINVSPFMRFDGYYVLSDFLKMPNLQYRAFALTRWQMRRILFGWQDPPPERFSRKMHNILIIYSVFTWLYRLSLYIGIAVLVYFMFFKVLGIILFLVEVYYFILDPFIKEFRTWLQMRDKFRLNTNTIVTCCVAVGAIGLFFIPFRDSVEIPATLSYSHQFLFAPEDGILVSRLPSPGTKTEANQVIAEIQSPSLDYTLNRTQLEYEKLSSEARRASVDDNFSKDKSSVMSNLEKKKSEYNKLLEIKNKLVLKIPFNGILIDVDDDLQKGSYVSKNEWLGDVINPAVQEVEAYVQQIDLHLLKPGMTGYFYPEDYSVDPIPVQLTLIEPLNPSQLVCQFSTKLTNVKKIDRKIIETPCYHSSDFGGEIPTQLSDKGEYVPVDSVYRAIFSVKSPTKIEHVERGHLVVNTRARSYAYRFFYQVKSILVQESGF